MPKWPWEIDKKEDDKKVDLPKELEDRFSSVKTDVTTEVTKKIDERFDALKPVLDFVSDAKKEREEREQREAEAARRKTEKETELTDEDLAAQLLTNPRAVITEALKPTQQLMLLNRADNIKREVFQDRASDFPYYGGDIKKEVDAMLEKQTLQFRNDPASIENVYHTVVGKHMAEINEGKIKSRFASSTSSSSSGPKSGESSERHIKVTPEIEKAARLSGMKTEDYVKLLEKDEEFDYVGE